MTSSGAAEADGGTLDVIVIGAGLVGLATAMALLASGPGCGSRCWRRSPRSAPTRAATTPASSTPGLYYQPGSLKARFCTAGRLAMMEFAERAPDPVPADRQAGRRHQGQRADPAGQPGRARAGERAGGPGDRPRRRSPRSSRRSAASARCTSRRAA